MKRTGYIFEDDGSPEASDYDTCYVAYDLADPGSYDRAAGAERRRMSSSSESAASATRPGQSWMLWRGIVGRLGRMHVRIRMTIERIKRVARCAAMCSALPIRAGM